MTRESEPGATSAARRGQALVELALIAPVLLLLLIGAIDLGRVWQSQITINNAAREGAMEGIFQPNSFIAGTACTSANQDSNRIMCRVVNEVRDSSITVTPADVAKSCSPSCTPGSVGAPSTLTVTVTGHFSLLTPLMAVFTGGQDITLTAAADATIAMTPTGGPVATPTPTPSPSPTPTPTPTGSPGPSPTPTATASPTPPPQPCVAPVANFSVSPATGKKKKTDFAFTDSSTNMANPACNRIWSWNFGDGTGASSSQNSVHQYDSAGTYTITLSVSNSAGTSTFQRSVNVTQ